MVVVVVVMVEAGLVFGGHGRWWQTYVPARTGVRTVVAMSGFDAPWKIGVLSRARPRAYCCTD